MSSSKKESALETHEKTIAKALEVYNEAIGPPWEVCKEAIAQADEAYDKVK